jgi:hypothetical protein
VAAEDTITMTPTTLKIENTGTLPESIVTMIASLKNIAVMRRMTTETVSEKEKGNEIGIASHAVIARTMNTMRRARLLCVPSRMGVGLREVI